MSQYNVLTEGKKDSIIKERKMIKRIIGSNKREEVIVKRSGFLIFVVSFCFFLIITIPFLIITKFSFINSFILPGVFFIIFQFSILVLPFNKGELEGISKHNGR